MVALGTGRIAELASGIGQELFNAAVLGHRRRHARVAQPVDVLARRRARRRRAQRGQRDQRRPARMLGAADRRRSRGAARRLRDRAVPVRDRRLRGRRVVADAGGRSRRHRRRHRGRLLALRGAAAHSAALVLHGDGRARPVPRRRHGVAGGALPDPGRHPAEPRRAAVGHLHAAAADLARRARCCTAWSATTPGPRACRSSSTSSCSSRSPPA